MGFGGKVLKVIYEGDVSELVNSYKQMGKAQADMAQGTKESAEATGRSWSNLGSTLTKTVTPIAGTIAGVTRAIGDSWTNTTKEMAVQTGAVGAELDGLMKSVQNVAGTVVGSVSDIGNVMSDLASKTGLAGQPLEDLTRRVLQLKELGHDLSGVEVATTFGGWGVAADQMGGALERVFKISQESGQSVSTLMGRLTEFRPQLQGLGYDFDTASLFVSRLTDAMVPGLRKALTEISKAHGDLAAIQIDAEKAQANYNKVVKKYGPDSLEAREAAQKLTEANKLLALALKDPKQAFEDMLTSIKNAKTEQDAMALGVEYFGSKSAPALVQAIRAGKFELEGLEKKLKENKNTIEDTSEKYLTFADRIGMAKEKVIAFIGPVANTLATISTIATGIGPAMLAVNAFTGGISLTAIALAVLTSPITWIVIAIAALAAGLIYAYNHSETFRNIVDGAFRAVADAAGLGVSFILGVLQTLVNTWFTTVGAVVNGAAAMFGWVPGVGPKLQDAADKFNSFRDGVNAAFDSAQEAAQSWGENTEATVASTHGRLTGWKGGFGMAGRMLGESLGYNLSVSAEPGNAATVQNAGATVGAVMAKTGAAAAAGQSVGGAVGSNMQSGSAPGLAATVRESNNSIDRVRSLSGLASSSGSIVGLAMGQGLLGGLLSMAGRLVSSAVTMVLNAFNAAKRALGIGSPSKLFAEGIGQPIPQGIAGGIEDDGEFITASLHQLLAQAYRETQRALSTIEGGRARGAAARSDALARADAARERASTARAQAMAHIENLHVTVQDPADIAPGIARELGWTLTGISRGRNGTGLRRS